MTIPFQNILFLKEFLACNVYFGLFSKIKKEWGTSFWNTFSAWSFHKNVPYLILYHWTNFQCHTLFPSQDMKQNTLLKLLSTIFYQMFIFSSSDRPSKTMKNVFHFILKALLVLEIFIFFASFPHCPDPKGQMEVE